jgi:hypothetical protein
MTTVRDLITDALDLVGVSAPGETVQAADAQRAFRALNRMLSSWNTEGLMVYSINIQTFTLTGNQQSYTIGPGGNFNTTRPERIEQAYLRVPSSSNLDLPLRLLTDSEWADIRLKPTTSDLPRMLYNDGNNPLSTLYLWPVPTQANVLVLYVWNQLSQYADLSDTVTLPPGYEEAIVYNLAVRLATSFGRPIPPEVSAIAATSKGAIKSVNITPTYLRCDDALVSHDTPTFNWMTGGFS